MASVKSYPRYVVIPVEVFDAAESLEELEDWLIAHNEELVAHLRRSREEQRRGKVKTAAEVRKELGL